MSVKKYGITPGYGFGGTKAPYSDTKPHHGIDYATPVGVPVIVAGISIALTGETGAADGPHVHIDKNRAYPATTGYVDPSDWDGIQGTVEFSGPAGTAGNMVVIRATNGFYYRFLHLSVINVSKGQTLGGDMYENKTAQEWYEAFKDAKPFKDAITEAGGGEFWSKDLAEDKALLKLGVQDIWKYKKDHENDVPAVPPGSLVVDKEKLWLAFGKLVKYQVYERFNIYKAVLDGHGRESD